MLFQARDSNSECRTSFFSLLVCLCSCLAASTFGQSPPTPPVNIQTAKPESEKAKAAGAKPAEPPPVLQQLNLAIEQLTARISPAVVQILVTGYGPVEENGRGETALISREHAIGSGVIVDSDGYI